jgi:hypothetical protein
MPVLALIINRVEGIISRVNQPYKCTSQKLNKSMFFRCLPYICANQTVNCRPDTPECPYRD